MSTAVLDSPAPLLPVTAFTPADLPATLAAKLLIRHVSTEDVEGPCWLWTGLTNDRGYGQIKLAGYLVTVHRAAYEQLVDFIPYGLELGHLCLVRACCNPAHLSPATQVENNRRRKAGSGEYCKKSHPRLVENQLVLGRLEDGTPAKITCRPCVQPKPRGQIPGDRPEPVATAALVLAWT